MQRSAALRHEEDRMKARVTAHRDFSIARIDDRV
jgi:hypothetical protein